MPQYDATQLDTVQHPTLGKLSFPKGMPFAERNQIIQGMVGSAPSAVPAQTAPPFGQITGISRAPSFSEDPVEWLRGAANRMEDLGRRAAPTVPGLGELIGSTLAGPAKMAHGIAGMPISDPETEALLRGQGIETPHPTPRAIARSTSEVVRGGLAVAAPVLVPLSGISGLASIPLYGAGQQLLEYGLKKAGMPEEYAALASDLGLLAAGFLHGKTRVQELDARHAAMVGDAQELAATVNDQHPDFKQYSPEVQAQTLETEIMKMWARKAQQSSDETIALAKAMGMKTPKPPAEWADIQPPQPPARPTVPEPDVPIQPSADGLAESMSENHGVDSVTAQLNAEKLLKAANGEGGISAAEQVDAQSLIEKYMGPERRLTAGESPTGAERRAAVPEVGLDRIETLVDQATNLVGKERYDALVELRELARHPVYGTEAELALREHERKPLGAQPSVLKPGQELPRALGQPIKSELPARSLEPAPLVPPPKPELTVEAAIRPDIIPGPLDAQLNRMVKIKGLLATPSMSAEMRAQLYAEGKARQATAKTEVVKWHRALLQEAPAAAASLRESAASIGDEATPDSVLGFLARSVTQHKTVDAFREAARNITRTGQEAGRLHKTATTTGEVYTDETGQQKVVGGEAGSEIVGGPSHAFREAIGNFMGKRRAEVPSTGERVAAEDVIPAVTAAKDELRGYQEAITAGELGPDELTEASGKMKILEDFIREHEQGLTKTHGRPTRAQVAVARNIPVSEVATTGTGEAVDPHAGLPYISSAMWLKHYAPGRRVGVPTLAMKQAKLAELRTRREQLLAIAKALDRLHGERGFVSFGGKRPSAINPQIAKLRAQEAKVAAMQERLRLEIRDRLGLSDKDAYSLLDVLDSPAIDTQAFLNIRMRVGEDLSLEWMLERQELNKQYDELQTEKQQLLGFEKIANAVGLKYLGSGAGLLQFHDPNTNNTFALKAEAVVTEESLKAARDNQVATATGEGSLAEFLAKEKKEGGFIKADLAVGMAKGAAIGAAAGAVAAGPAGAAIGAVVGGAIGGVGIGRSRRVLTELANDGISLSPTPKDLTVRARLFGSFSQQAGIHPAAREAATLMMNKSIDLSVAQREASHKVNQVLASLKKGEWDMNVDLLNNEEVIPENISEHTPSESLREGYKVIRAMLDSQRIRMIEARRRADVNAGYSEAKAIARTPDDWGIRRGYYQHVFPGDWSVMKQVTDDAGNEDDDAGNDDAGNEKWVPLSQDMDAETAPSWLHVTQDDAVEAASTFKKSNPEAKLQVKRLTAAPQSGATSTLNKLRNLAGDLRKASLLEGAELEEAMGDIAGHAGAAAYGPGATRRMFRGALPRKANLPGWARDPESFLQGVMAAERYIALVDARPLLLSLRNEVARTFDAASLTKVKELQTGLPGILGAMDSAIQAFEGYSNRFETMVRTMLGRRGLDPNLLDKFQARGLELEGMLKLGFSPISALTNLTQTMTNTYPVLGERWTAVGISAFVGGKQKFLLEGNGIFPTPYKIDTDTMSEYLTQYRPKTLKDVPGATWKLAGYSSLWMFSQAEYANRGIAFLGAYARARNAGASYGDAQSAAREIVARTQFMPGRWDKAAALRALPQNVGQFKSFSFKQLEYILGIRGSEIPRFLAAMALLGVLGLTGLDLLDDIFEGATGWRPVNTLRTRTGTMGAKLLRGIPGLLGIDMTRNVGFVDAFTPRLRNVLGPLVSDAYAFMQAIPAFAHDILGYPPGSQAHELAKDQFVRSLSPQARRIFDYWDSDDALRDPTTGKPILQRLTPLEQLEMGLGMTPIRVSTERDLSDEARMLNQKYADTRDYYVSEISQSMNALSNPKLSDRQKKFYEDRITQLFTEAGKLGPSVLFNLDKSIENYLGDLVLDRQMRGLINAPTIVKPDIINLYKEGPDVTTPAP